MRIKFQMHSGLQNVLSKLQSLVTRLENHPILTRVPKRYIRPALATIALLLLGSAIYFPITVLNTRNTTESTETLQTATVRTGDLVIYANGTGTLTAANEVDLAFDTSGQVTRVSVKVGDKVNKGDQLAEMDDTDAQFQYEEAQHSLRELTSVGAIASAQEAAAAAQTDLDSAIRHLKYLISPDVYYWELEVEQAKAELEAAQTAYDADPASAQIKEKLEEAEAYLDFAEDELYGNRIYYKEEYLPINFTMYARTKDEYIAAPTETDIKEARAAVSVAEATLQEAEYLYAALTGGEVPEDASGSGLTALEQAQLDMQAAQAKVDGTRIIAPFPGTIMSVDTSVGDTAGTTAVISLADLSQYYIEFFLDESDWNNVAIGYEAEITFDAMPDETFNGEVIQVDPGLYTSGNTSVVRAIVKLETREAEFNLPVGTGAAVDVIGGRAENAVLVPVEAVHQAGEQYTVFVLENGKPRLRLVEVGIQDAQYAVIKSGLAAGEVVTTGITETK